MNRALRRVRAAFVRALGAMDLATRVAAALPAKMPSNLLVVAVGKAAPEMVRGALRRAAGAWGIVVTTDGTRCALDRRRFTVLRAGHPLPDARSVRAARRILSEVAPHDGPVLVLVSGGASALVCAPVAGLTLARKRAVTKRLLFGGASVQELNTVRRHLSCIKGGGLARVARGAMRTIVASDVIRGTPSDVGSGISVADRTTARDARDIARRHALGRLPFCETVKSTRVSSRARIVASPELLARSVVHELARAGLHARITRPATATVESLADRYVRAARSLRPGHALVTPAEPTVRVSVRKPGRGGRSTHLAALVAPRLPPGVVFLAGASDGVDGVSGTAGAVVEASSKLSELDRALARFDTGPLHLRAGTAIVTGPTGLNLADVHILARMPRHSAKPNRPADS